MYKTAMIAACVAGFLGVALGAFGAHGLKKVAGPDVLEIWNKGVSYQLWHAAALLACGLAYAFAPSPTLRWASWLFIAGIVLFSGSLYGLSGAKISGQQSSFGFLGPITPVGGLCFLAGWLCMMLAFIRIR